MNTRRIIWAWMVLAPLTLIACGSDEDDDDTEGSAGARVAAIQALTPDATAGKATFEAQCVTCHGADGRGGSAHENVPGTAKAQSVEFLEIVLSGEEAMPAFANTLSDQQIADLLGYAKTL